MSFGERAEAHIFGEGELSYFITTCPSLNSKDTYRSVHNVRIKCLWGDVTAQVTATWRDDFVALELHHGLDVNNIHHIWLIHHLFLPIINSQLDFFTNGWNHHRIAIRNGPNRSPIDMFGFDSIANGMRGDPLPEDLTAEELEVFGVDWEGLRDRHLLDLRQHHNSYSEGTSTWAGRTGPPDNLNEVVVESPPSLHPDDLVGLFDTELQHRLTLLEGDGGIEVTWEQALTLA